MTFTETEVLSTMTGKSPISYLTKTPENCLSGFLRNSGHLAILDAMSLPVMLISNKYIYEWVNSAYASAHEKKPSDIIGKTVPAVLGQELFNGHIKENLDRCLEGREVRQEAWINFSALGRRYYEIVYSPYRQDDTNSTWAIVVTYDMTERRNAEQQVENSERRFRSLSEASLEAIVFIENGVIVDANQALDALFGYQKGEVRGKLVIDFIALEWRETTLKRMNKRIEGSYETVGLRKDGTTFPIEVTAREFEENGRRMRISAAKDLTERKRIEGELKAYQEHLERLVEERSTELIRTNEELKKSEEKYRNIVDNAVEGIFQTTMDGRILSANPALAQMFGCESPEELIRSVSNIGTDIYADPQRRRDLMSCLKRDGVVRNFEFEAKRQEGTFRWASINVRAMKDNSGNIVCIEGTMVDITDHKEMEKALLESEERYRIAIEHSNDGVVITRGNEHLYVNRRYVEMFGYESAEELIGKPLSAAVHPDDLDRVTDISCRRMRGEPAPLTYEFKGRRKDGSSLYAETSVASIIYQGEPASLAYIRDITQRRHAEEAMLRIRREYEQLGIARTKVIDRLAHEMRTPISIIQGNLMLLKKRLGDHAPSSNMNSLERNVERLSRVAWDAQRTFDAYRFVEAIDLHEEIGWFAKRIGLIQEIPSHVRDQLNTLREWTCQYLAQSEGSKNARKIYPEIQQVISNVKHQATRELSFYHKGDDELQLAIDKVVLNEIMDALLKNAVENTPDGGIISVLCGRKYNGAEIHVADTGIGITEESQKYLFSGFLFARESDFYSSGKPFMFGAGGKGLDLLRIRLYGRRYGFHISVKSQRCPHLPQDRDRCPGSVNFCHHCSRPGDCLESGGTTFSLVFPDA
jgi:PAS domain S-box-containing protein